MPMPTLPDHVKPYRTLGPFTEDTLPAGLRREHTLKPETWALVEVEAGAVTLDLQGETHRLAPGRPGVIPPEVPHAVNPETATRFRVVFHSAP